MSKTGWHRSRGPTLVAIGLAIAVTIGPFAGVTAYAADPLPGRSESGRGRDVREVLRGELRRLATDPLSSLQRRTILGELLNRQGRSGPEIAVTIRLDSAADSRMLSRLAGSGARAVNVGTQAVEAYVAPEDLAGLAGIPGVRSVRPILRPLSAYVSPGVALHGASGWQTAGITGARVKVGIIDGGFAGLVARLGTELPATVQARCYTAMGSFSTDLAICENGESHGTAVAETVVDMAPGVQLFIADPISGLDTRETIAWMTSNGVRIINASTASVYLFDGPGDGTSPYLDSSYALVDQAVAGGALWVNSAGNEGAGGWTGSWTDADGDGLLEWKDGDARNSMTLATGQEVTIAIRWADPWGVSSNDYDLELWSGASLVASSEDVQAGAGDPYEFLNYTALAAGTYDIAVRRLVGAPTTRMQLLVSGLDEGQLRYQVAAGTLPAPADSANPGMVTVGAVNVATPETIEPYSSRGPTLDDRIKPDLVAADCADTTVEARFCGTSQSAPFVAGAAALVLQADPALTPRQLADRLRSGAVPLGSSVPNATYGWGRLALGAPPVVPGWTIALTPASSAIAPSGSTLIAVSVKDSLGTSAADGTVVSLTTTGSGAVYGSSGASTSPTLAGSASFTYLAPASDDAATLTATARGAVGVGTAVVAVGTGIAPPPPVPVPPVVVSTYGQSTGVDRPTGPGSSFLLQTSPDLTSWSTFGTYPMDPTAGPTVAVKILSNGYLRSLVPGLNPSAPTRTLVRQSLAIRPISTLPRRISRGTTIILSATVRPIASGTVKFQVFRSVSGRWVAYATRTASTDAQGIARLARRFSIIGNWYVRATANSTARNAGSVPMGSSVFSVR